MEEITSGEVLVGDVIYVGDGEDIPADVVLLGGGIEQEGQTQSGRSGPQSPSTALDGGARLELGKAARVNIDDQTACFLQTSSLDGEKNLKKKMTP